MSLRILFAFHLLIDVLAHICSLCGARSESEAKILSIFSVWACLSAFSSSSATGLLSGFIAESSFSDSFFSFLLPGSLLIAIVLRFTKTGILRKRSSKLSSPSSGMYTGITRPTLFISLSSRNTRGLSLLVYSTTTCLVPVSYKALNTSDNCLALTLWIPNFRIRSWAFSWSFGLSSCFILSFASLRIVNAWPSNNSILKRPSKRSLGERGITAL